MTQFVHRRVIVKKLVILAVATHGHYTSKLGNVGEQPGPIYASNFTQPIPS